MKNNPRRTQAERSAATREALIAAGRALFAEHGFSGVGTETIVREAGVTRGAMYHQFADKTELFAAVFETVEADVMARLGAVIAERAVADPIEAMEIGAYTWLEVCAEPEIARITLIDAPAVLGWLRWREIGHKYALGLVEALLAHGIETGRIVAQPAKPLAHVFIGAVDEAALYVVRAEDPEQARAEMRRVVSQLVSAMAVESS